MVWVVSAGMLAGSFFCLVSAFGTLRMKDSYARMHVATKSVAFGGALLVITYVLAQPTVTNLVVGVLVVSFFYMTLPLAGHFLGRTIYRRGIDPARPFKVDEAKGWIILHDPSQE
jgi:monovalent cation/proton antiporter MnhG/PhaG subunit